MKEREKYPKPHTIYCPFCKRTITPSNKDRHHYEDRIFLHDSVPHDLEYDFSPLH